MGPAQAAELVLDELLTNIISYGYTDSDTHQITVELTVVDGAMTIRIVDDGVAFNPFEQDAPDLESSIERRELGGLGIHLVKKFMDDYSYQRSDEFNIVTLSKSLAP
jgi:anti-sigma regulatory factor (Ser/Thr protein kinase)